MIIPLLMFLSLTNVDKDSREYDLCVESHPCPHDGEDLKKLHKKEYEKVMKCRITRHLECIKTETETKK